MRLTIFIRRIVTLPGRKADLRWWVDTISGIALFGSAAIACRAARFNFNLADTFAVIGG